MIATPAQIKAARALKGWSTEDLAVRMGLARNSITRMENQGLERNVSALATATRIFEDEGIAFIQRDAFGGEGVRLVGPRAPAVPRAARGMP